MRTLIDKFCYYSFGVKIPFFLQYAIPLIIFYDFFARLIKSRYFRYLIILIPPVIIFIRLLRNDPFFLSDDFAHLKIVSENSYLDIARMAFTENGIWVGHRIIGAFWLFKAIFSIFGIKAEAFIATNFILHSTNVLLFYLIVQKLKKTSVALLTAFVLGTFYLAWISNMHEIMAATFVLLSTLFWVKLLSGQKKAYLLAILFYVLAILTKEITFLLPISFATISLFYYHNVSRLNVQKVSKYLISFFIIFFIYLFTYGVGFLNYRNLPSQDSYKIGLKIASMAENFLYYSGYTFPIFKTSLTALIVLFASFVLFDLIKRKPIITPFLVSFLSFVGPALLFEKRTSYYYAYIATFFLFIGLTFFLDRAQSIFKSLLKNKPKIWIKVLNVYFVLFLAITVFRVDKILMDNCFLIQYPWKNEHKILMTKIAKRIEELIEKGEIKKGVEIPLAEDEVVPEMTLVYDAGILPLFIIGREAGSMKFIFNENKSSLFVKEFFPSR